MYVKIGNTRRTTVTPVWEVIFDAAGLLARDKRNSLAESCRSKQVSRKKT
jgi:hypothetical protein